MDFDLCWPLWQTRLTEERAIDTREAAALDRLRNYALPLVDPKHHDLFNWDAVLDATEWQHIRELAAEALRTLQGRYFVGVSSGTLAQPKAMSPMS
jgi:hypothetical protein